MDLDQIRAVIEDVLSRRLGGQGFSHAVVTETENVEGEPALAVRSIFRPGGITLTGADSIWAKHAVRRALLARGEDRFPYVRHELPEPDAA